MRQFKKYKTTDLFLWEETESNFFDIITKGHAWVCDGYEVRQTQYASLVWGSKFNIPDMEEPDYFFTNGTYDTSEFLHMNWGWGENGGNGWYILTTYIIELMMSAII
ncbi:C10 family peptidase [Bacteroides fragilis]